MIFQPAESKTALRHVLAQAARVEVVGDGAAGGRIMEVLTTPILVIMILITRKYLINILFENLQTKY